jgi:hypothetical protein
MELTIAINGSKRVDGEGPEDRAQPQQQDETQPMGEQRPGTH